jgi:hypothetical protein
VPIPAHEVCGSERDSSGTTRNRMKCGAGDGADSPTRVADAKRPPEAARPKKQVDIMYI